MLCLSCNIPYPCTTGMQQAANKVVVRWKKQVQKDLVYQTEVNKVNTLRGEKPNIIKAQADCAYNNALYYGIG